MRGGTTNEASGLGLEGLTEFNLYGACLTRLSLRLLIDQANLKLDSRDTMTLVNMITL